MNTDQIRIAVAECLGLPIPCQGEHEPYEVFHKYSAIHACRLYKCRNCVMHKWEEHPEWETDNEREIPNWPSCLNACADMLATLINEEKERYLNEMEDILLRGKPHGVELSLLWELHTATPMQICEAYLRVKGKWTSADQHRQHPTEQAGALEINPRGSDAKGRESEQDQGDNHEHEGDIHSDPSAR